MAAAETVKPFVSVAFSKLQGEIDSLLASGKAKTEPASSGNPDSLLVAVDALKELADYATTQGITVRVLSTLSSKFVEVGFRALIKLDGLPPNYKATGVDFIALSHECETD